MVWLGTPLYYRLIPEDYRGLIVYDLMDDIVALQRNGRVAAFTAAMHKKLLKRADIIFVTSEYLNKGLSVNEQEKAFLLRNGFESGRTINPGSYKRSIESDRFKIGYTGTIT